jgi:hypothetical protein
VRAWVVVTIAGGLFGMPKSALADESEPDFLVLDLEAD